MPGECYPHIKKTDLERMAVQATDNETGNEAIKDQLSFKSPQKNSQGSLKNAVSPVLQENIVLAVKSQSPFKYV